VTHPSSLDLEAFACGEKIALVDAHVDACAECRAFVDELAAGAKAFASSIEEGLDALLEKAGARIAPEAPARVVSLADERNARDAHKKKSSLVMLLPLVAVAAGVVVWIALPSLSPAPKTTMNTATPTSVPTGPATEDPETTFKGGVQIAVVRDRDGHQDRFTSRVVVRPGDRLRIEVALDRSEAILAGVLADDGTFLPLMAEGTRGQGTHFSEQAARFDDDPTRGWILVGPADAIEKSKAARAPVKGVTSMRLEWEPR
jgi:hypothetical protein